MEMTRTVGWSPLIRSLSVVPSGRCLKQRCERNNDQRCMTRGLSERTSDALEDIWEPLPEFLSAALLNTSIFVDGSYALESSATTDATGNGFLVNAAGAGYVLLVAYFLFRVLTKRANRFTSQRVAGTDQTEGNKTDAADVDDTRKDMTLVDGIIGILQSGALAAGLYFFTTKVDAVLLTADLPDQYTAHNIAITVRTIIRGLCYLLTFIFTMNCIGLTGLTVKLAINPESVNEAPLPQPKESESQLPKISVLSDPDEVARAFDEVSKRTSSDE